MKDYSNPSRKPMMYGGMTDKKKAMGGMAKPQMGNQSQAVGVTPMMYGGKAKKK